MLKVLIVEDNGYFRETFKMVFQKRFPAVVIEEAGTGEEALQRIQGMAPDLLFMDIQLPGVNGLELTQKIKRDFPNIRIAMLTSYDLPEYRRAAARFGSDRFFIKDLLDWEEIKEFVEYLLG